MMRWMTTQVRNEIARRGIPAGLAVFHVDGGAGFHFGKEPAGQELLFFGQVAGDAVLPAVDNLQNLGQQVQGLLARAQLQHPLVRGGGRAGDEALFLQDSRLTSHVALVDADAPGQTILGNTRIFTDHRQIAGVSGLQPHGSQPGGAVQGAAAGDFSDIPDDL